MHGDSRLFVSQSKIVKDSQTKQLTEAIVDSRSPLLEGGHVLSTRFTLCLPLLVLVCAQWTRLAHITINQLSSGAVSCDITGLTCHKYLTRLPPRYSTLVGWWTRKPFGLSIVQPIYLSISRPSYVYVYFIFKYNNPTSTYTIT